jgi:methyl coenzyme M reductase subunit D
MQTVKFLWNTHARLKAEIAKQWKELPPRIKHASTLNTFKNRLDSLENFQRLFVEGRGLPSPYLSTYQPTYH